VRGHDGDGRYPDLEAGWTVLDALQRLGWSLTGGMGPVPLTAQEITAWATGTMADLGPRDFQDVLDVSRAFVGSVGEYQGRMVDPPWSPVLTPEEQEIADAAEEDAMDRMMGLR